MATLPRAASGTATNAVLFRLLTANDLASSTILDLGAGRGHLTARLADHLRGAAGSSGPPLSERLFACDVDPSAYRCEDVPCRFADANEALPYADAQFDYVVTQEVVEHLTRPYDFIAEIHRILKPGGTVILTTPNINSLRSRLALLFTGFHAMFEPLSFRREDAGRLCGHIMPLGYFYLEHWMRRVGFEATQTHVDKISGTNRLLYALLGPLLHVFSARHRRRIARKDDYLVEVNRSALATQNSFEMLCARSCIIAARKGLAAR